MPMMDDRTNGQVRRSEPPWHEIASSPAFRRLESRRRRAQMVTIGVFSLATGVFLVLSGFARPFMRTSIDGGLTVADVWILGLTVLTWVLVWSYLRFADRLESAAKRMLERGGYGEQTR